MRLHRDSNKLVLRIRLENTKNGNKEGTMVKRNRFQPFEAPEKQRDGKQRSIATKNKGNSCFIEMDCMKKTPFVT